MAREDPPKYRQIAGELRARIETGEYPPGSRLPSKAELMSRFSVALNTVDNAIRVLRDLGLAETKQGLGTFVSDPLPAAQPSSEYEAVTKRLDDVAEEVRQLRERLAAVERQVLQGEPSSMPEPQPVVAAIVTSPKGVLVAKRQDGKPPWTFIAGEIEPGESPADAAVREVKEETGLRVRAGGIIGRRVHPATKRTMVYMAATPTHGTGAFVGDEDELAEVRWVSLREASELMGGTIYEPVREHLRQALPEGLQ
jgi:8-oxo-dGTP pyrophosphatase MutT (NUDIX family)/DNA-binding transcriptional regulator YhcF (GntR family)